MRAIPRVQKAIETLGQLGQPAVATNEPEQNTSVCPLAMSHQHPHEHALRSSVRTRTLIGLALVATFGLGSWLALNWHLLLQQDVPPPSSIRLARPAPRAALQLNQQVQPQQTPPPAAAPEPPDDASSFSEADYRTNLACYEHPLKEIDQESITKLASGFPALSQVLGSDNPNLDPKLVRPLLENLLQAARTAPAEAKPALLLAANSAAARLVLPDDPRSPDAKLQMDSLDAEGLTFRWAELDGWFYKNDLLWKLHQEYPATDEGANALLLLLRNGWGSAPCCSTGSDPFRAVIQHGEEFLAHRPQPPHRMEMLFLLAQAHDTWWSLSRVPEQSQREGDPRPESYREGATAARDKAIVYYKEIVESAPQSVEADCSRKPLQLLHDNQDTHQRRFYCYCD